MFRQRHMEFRGKPCVAKVHGMNNTVKGTATQNISRKTMCREGNHAIMVVRWAAGCGCGAGRGWGGGRAGGPRGGGEVVARQQRDGCEAAAGWLQRGSRLPHPLTA